MDDERCDNEGDETVRVNGMKVWDADQNEAGEVKQR